MGPPLPPDGRRLLRPREVAVIAVVGLGLAMLFNVTPMKRTAETSSFGMRRSLSLAVLGPISRVSDALWLDRPRQALDAVVGDGGRGMAPAEEEFLGDATAAARVAHHRRRPPLASPSTTPRHPWTAQDPLRLWVGGDSVAGFLSIEMVELAEQSGVIVAHGHYKISTGLSRPDYYDWPAHLRQDLAAYDPEVVVFMVGANDDQPLAVEDRVYEFGSPEWRAEYARRVAAVMDMVTSQRRLLLWVGQPVMRSPDFDARMQFLNAIYRREAEEHPGVMYVDSRPLLSDRGSYSAYLPDAAGNQTLVRAPDGIHLTPQGGMRLASAVLDAVRTWWDEVPPGPGLPPRSY